MSLHYYLLIQKMVFDDTLYHCKYRWRERISIAEFVITSVWNFRFVTLIWALFIYYFITIII